MRSAFDRNLVMRRTTVFHDDFQLPRLRNFQTQDGLF